MTSTGLLGSKGSSGSIAEIYQHGQHVEPMEILAHKRDKHWKKHMKIEDIEAKQKYTVTVLTNKRTSAVSHWSLAFQLSDGKGEYVYVTELEAVFQGDGSRICASHLGAIDVDDYCDVLHTKSLKKHVLGTAIFSIEDIFDFGQGASTNDKEYLAGERNCQTYVAEILTKIIEVDALNKDTIDPAVLPWSIKKTIGETNDWIAGILGAHGLIAALAAAEAAPAAPLVAAVATGVATGVVVGAVAQYVLPAVSPKIVNEIHTSLG